jgi:hypothetical protein
MSDIDERDYLNQNRFKDLDELPENQSELLAEFERRRRVIADKILGKIVW